MDRFDALTIVDARGCLVEMEPIRFTGKIRYWDPTKGSGLAVVDIPSEHDQSYIDRLMPPR